MQRVENVGKKTKKIWVITAVKGPKKRNCHDTFLPHLLNKRNCWLYLTNVIYKFLRLDELNI